MAVTVSQTRLPGVVVVEPEVFGDERGFFFESFNSHEFQKKVDPRVSFVQDNHSRSVKGVLRGLHYQIRRPQGKLIRVVHGAIYDVAVDIRRGSPTFGHWCGVELSAENRKQLWVPPDFAHGFLVVSELAEVLYKATDHYAPEFDRSISWDDPDIGIDWPETGHSPNLSQKDQMAVRLTDAELPSCKA
jgi:dTDP-4-dehydrorhamnose 3,5-epimerase